MAIVCGCQLDLSTPSPTPPPMTDPNLRTFDRSTRQRLQELPPPGRAPYGYRRTRQRYILDRHAAPIVKDFFDRFLLYGSLRGAVRHLETKHHKKISVSTAERWLESPVYRGDTGYLNGDRLLDTHPAIISRAEAAQIDRLLHQHHQLPHRTASATKSLAGLVHCGECGITMGVTSTTDKYAYLRPNKCPKASKCSSLAYDRILTLTIDRLCRDFTVAVNKLTDLTDIDPTAARSSSIAQIDRLRQQIATTDLDIIDRYHLKTAIARLQQQVDSLSPINLSALAQAVSLPQFWADLSEAERRFYFREFIDRITIVDRDGELDLELKFKFEP
jgi:hypothetical protein